MPLTESQLFEFRSPHVRIPQPEFTLLGKRHAITSHPYDAGPFIIPAGFQFDGASMPWWVWSAIRLSPFDTIVGPACGHDLLYVQCGRVRLKDGSWVTVTKAQADDYFYGRCMAENVEMSWLQERLVRRAVKVFGRYDKKRKSNCYKWNVNWLNEYNSATL